MWEPVIEILKQTLMTVLIGVVSLLGAYAIYYLNKLKVKLEAEAQNINDENVRKLAENAIKRISEIVTTVVGSIQQELVDDIKLGIEQGTHTREELLELKDMAIQNIMNQITPEIAEAATTQIQDINQYIADLVSAAVLALRIEEKYTNPVVLIEEPAVPVNEDPIG